LDHHNSKSKTKAQEREAAFATSPPSSYLLFFLFFFELLFFFLELPLLLTGPLLVLRILQTERLTGILQYISPERPFKIHMVTGTDSNIDGKMDEPVVHQTYQELGLSCHGRMHSMSTQAGTIDRVKGVCRSTSDDVGRIDILHIAFDALFGKILKNLILEEKTDVMELEIA
jgi:hypothetical protein